MSEQPKLPKGFIGVPRTPQPPVQKRDYSLDAPEETPRVAAPSQKAIADFEALDQARRDQLEKAQREPPTQPQEGQEAPTEGKDALKEIKDDLPMDLDVFGLDPERRKLLSSLIGPEQKKLAEDRSTPLHMSDFFVSGEFRQTVVVRRPRPGEPGVKVTFRTLSSFENVEISKYCQRYDELPAMTANEVTLLCMEACSIAALNDEESPPHVIKGKFEVSVFEQKLRKVMGWPIQLNAMLTTHCAWFDERVRKFLVEDGEEEVKNG